MESYNFYMQAKVVKRDGGRAADRRRSIIATAAYRAAENLHDETIDKTFHYAHRKDDVESTKIIAPAGAPDWVQDRSTLWNRVELAEKRKDAQLAREVIFQFPHEVPLETCLKMIWAFCERHFARHGMVADIAVHGPGAGDQRNTHAHVLLTMRHLEPDGFGLKNRAWNANQMLEDWRAEWEEMCNKALADLQSDIRFDRRSIADQRAEKLDAAEATFNWIKRRQFQIEAERLNYRPRPHLPQKIYRAMVAGDAIPEEYQAAVAEWQRARDSKAAARTRAAEMQRQLDAEVEAAKRAEAEAAAGEQAGAEPDSLPEAQDLSLAAAGEAEPRLLDPEMLDVSAGAITDPAAAKIDAWWRDQVETSPELAGLTVLLAEDYPDQDVMDLIILASDLRSDAMGEGSHDLHGYLPQFVNIGLRTLEGGWQRFPPLRAAIHRYQKIRFDRDPDFGANLEHSGETETPWDPDLDADLPSTEGTDPDTPPLPPETPAPTVAEPLSGPAPSEAAPEPPAPAPEAPDSSQPPKEQESDPERPEPAISDADTADAPAPDPDPVQGAPVPDPAPETVDSAVASSNPYWELERQMLALQRDQKDRQGAQRRREQQDKREADRKARMERVRREEADPISWAVEELFSPYPSLEDATYNPPGEWFRALALRMLDPEQAELRQLLEHDFQLNVQDPIVLRKSISALSGTDRMRMVIAIDDLDQKMDADPDRNWKQRRQAFTEMIDFHRDQRVCPEQSRESPIHIFKTTIKSICERSGLKSFYDNVLVPLVSRIAEALRLKAPQPSSKPDPDRDPSSGGSDYGMS